MAGSRFLKTFFLVLMVLIYLTLPVFAQEAPQASHFQQGITLFYSKDWDNAISEFNSALQEDPYNTLALTFMLDAYVKKDNLNFILNKLEQQSISKPDDPLSQTYLGIAYFTQGLMRPNMADEAVQQFKLALKTDPQFAMAHTGMGMYYFQKRMIPRAKGHFLKALQLNPKDMVAMELLGNILLVDEKNPQEALAVYNKEQEITPQNYADVYYYIGSSLYDIGKFEDAIPALQTCMKFDPNGILMGYQAPLLLGDLYMKMKKYKEAADAYKEALKINPQNPYAKYKLEKALKPPKN
ncbi:MAG: tetratricopeptide repeat protein [Firmicutes bacterium]|nr:tetratricopeptide repeat protein [Bacillota bacterium]